MLITITGSGDSGKSTFAIKLAKEISKQKKDVVIVFTDYYTPTFITFFPEEVEEGSLGKVLSYPILTRDIILSEMNIVKGEEGISFLGYRAKENKNQFANYTKQKAEDFILQLKQMVDVVIVDCQMAFYEDLLSITAIEAGDIRLNFTKADLKGLSYYKTQISFFVGIENIIQVVSDTDDSRLSNEVADEIGRVDFFIPFTKEIADQFIEEKLLMPMGKKGKEYELTIKKLVKSLNIGGIK